MDAAGHTLRKKILHEMQRLEDNLDNETKATYRNLHKPSVEFHLEQHQLWLERNYPEYSKYFANGQDIDPETITPELIEVATSWQSDLFRVARLTWSLPYSRGYGRRLRFLILDGSNQKLIGIMGLQSPPLDFPVRDRLFAYPSGKKVEFVNQTMDIFTLGAVPPYNRLLGGKLVALAAASDEVRDAYKKRYDGQKTRMEQRTLPSDLVALTTTSAFGRSSIYNRLKYKDHLVAQSIGYTEGYGSFHLTSLYPLLREYLRHEGVELPKGFGSGPRAVWQTCKIAFRHLGLPSELLKHGLKREAFLFPLVENLEEFMCGDEQQPRYIRQPFSDLAEWWHRRWLLPRSERVDGWHAWDREEIRRALFTEENEDNGE